ncbi:MAG: c-type cytochrome [Flavobacteriales bacterium]|nr:c-type cytochrome [Flavobacteriales bacterium]
MIPKKWPEPVYQFENNPLSEEGFRLGRDLFYDVNLSRDKSISCANCHLQYTGFTHVDHKVSHGIEGRKGTRNSPVLINLIWNNSFHWDGGVNHIEVQSINPIKHPAEMDNTLKNVLSYLQKSSNYKMKFSRVFGDTIISTKRLLQAITQFTGSLISSNSRYDQYQRKEIEFSIQEKKGLKLFKKNCNSCHTAPLFNSNNLESNGLPIDTIFNDLGRYTITQLKKDSMKFRVPTLRNIEVTFPYMHDGRYKKLREVIKYYTEELNTKTTYLSPRLKRKISLNSNEQKDLIAFLLTLTDKEFLYNKRFSFPRK